MFLCTRCGKIFDEPIAFFGEKTEHFGIPCREEFSGCPSCGNSFVETYRCDVCNEYIVGDYILTNDNKKYCEDCYLEYNIYET